MIITEYAPYGSAQDLINSYSINNEKKIIPIHKVNLEFRLKIIKDCAYGIQYLHNNGILHRDIKPDNLLILNLDCNGIIAKLTDFGSSRNINALMTNITFTKGIGTPKYMSPEILNRQHYKKPSDIYSFAITMYELITLQPSFPKSIFKYPWNIASFIIDGKRPDISLLDNKYKSLLENSWKQNPIDRLTIDQIIELI